MIGFVVNDAVSITAILGVVVPAIFVAVKMVQRQTVHSLSTALTDMGHGTQIEAHGRRIDEIMEVMSELAEALQAHMDSEEETGNQIRELQVELVHKLDKLDVKFSERVVSIVRSVSSLDPTPTFVHEVWNGGYQMVWANQSYLDLIGLTLPEAQAGMFWLSISADEREIIRKSSETIGQEKQEWESDYTLVNARTQQRIGKVRSFGYSVPAAGEHWYYISQLRVLGDD